MAKRHVWFIVCVTTLVVILAGSAQASITSATFSGSNTSLGLSASAVFTVNDATGTMTVLLKNTSTSDVMNPSQILTAMFFDPKPTFSRVSAAVASGSTVLFGITDPGNVVGGEWAFNQTLSGAPGLAALGISSSGLDLFAPSDVFPGTNLQGPGEPDGLQYGITSAGDNSATGNTPVTGTNALIQNAVLFTFSFTPTAFNAAEISDVSFQYGTALTDPNVPGLPPTGQGDVPEPATLIIWSLLGLSGGGLWAWSRRKGDESIGSARTPWSEDTRAAILQIVDRGRSLG
jgi:hypothetical protein